MQTFLGIDLGWYGKPTGLASIRLDPATGLHLQKTIRLQPIPEILAWIQTESAAGTTVLGIDAPTVIRNACGIRPAERELNRDFRRFHAGCHPANLSRPFAPHVLAFSELLAQNGFLHGAGMAPREEGRFQIEVHPHSASVSLFNLDRIVKYKRGARAARARELGRLRRLMLTRLPLADPPLNLRLPRLPPAGNLKPVEDRIDAVLCAYIAAHWWCWGRTRNRVYGCADSGYIVVPRPRASSPP